MSAWRIVVSGCLGSAALLMAFVAGTNIRLALLFPMGLVLLLGSMAFAQDDGASRKESTHDR